MALSSMWQRLYLALLAVLLVAAIAAGVTFLVRKSASPGLEVIIPTATATPETKAYISGAVRSPGVYTMEADERLTDLVRKAGGALEDADLDRVNLAQQVSDQEHFYIPRYGEEMPTPGDGRIDINTASLELLKTLPGIGDVKAEAIIAYRKDSGLFQTVDDLMNVDGIGTVTYENLRDLITIRNR